MNQATGIPIGVDATQYCGYAQVANDRLGNVDFEIENTGTNPVVVWVAQYDGVTAPSGFAKIGSTYNIVPGGTMTKSYSILSKKIAFFGSGYNAAVGVGSTASSKVNITGTVRNPSNLRGAQFDIAAAGRTGWGTDPGWNSAELTKKWGTVNSTLNTTGYGAINLGGDGGATTNVP